MIISRTPYRVSFFGGGTDYPGWYRKHGGAVLSTSIDKYCYLTCRYLPPFFDTRIRVVYGRLENVNEIDEIQHPAVREIVRHLGITRGLCVQHDGDLPARSGVGSSSSFSVGLLNALHALEGRMLSKHELATTAMHIEQDVLKETVGSQDQVAAAYGGFNHISFLPNGEISVRPITVTADRMHELKSHLMLFYTGIKRTAETVAKSYVNDLESRGRQLRMLSQFVDEGVSLLAGGHPIKEFGQLLHEGWLTKRALSEKVSNPEVDELYEAARAAGAVGGKLMGAGGGGFVLLFVPPQFQAAVRARFERLIHVPFDFDSGGSQIIVYDPERDYAGVEAASAKGKVVPFRELDPHDPLGDQAHSPRPPAAINL